MLPNNDNIERRLVLDASSSMSPWRGSIKSDETAVAFFALLVQWVFGAMRPLPEAGGSLAHFADCAL